MSETTTLQRRTGGGFMRGFSPLFQKESKTWWGGRRWLFQAILWQVVINGLLFMVLFVLPGVVPADSGMTADPVLNGLQGFFNIGALVLAIGVITLAQDALTAEVQSGTAEWLLAKPVTRQAFILAKFAAQAIGMLVVLTLLPGLVGYILLSVAGTVSLSGFVAGLAVLALHTTFYLVLTFLLGALTRNRMITLAGGLVVLFTGQVAMSLAPLLGVNMALLPTPWPLTAVATALAGGLDLPAQMFIPIGATIIGCVLGLLATIVLFDRLEL
jgi:ABC-2 type transport system permease protein